MLPPHRTPPSFAFALKITSFGAQVGLTAAIALFVADVAGQMAPRHPALLFGLAGGTSALLSWRLFGRFFSRIGRSA